MRVADTSSFRLTAFLFHPAPSGYINDLSPASAEGVSYRNEATCISMENAIILPVLSFSMLAVCPLLFSHRRQHQIITDIQGAVDYP